MGSHISYSSDDEFLRISINCDDNLLLKQQLFSELKACGFAKISTFTMTNLEILLIKIKVIELDKVFSLIFTMNFFKLLFLSFFIH